MEKAKEFFSSLQQNNLNPTRKTHAYLLNTSGKPFGSCVRCLPTAQTIDDHIWMRFVHPQ